ncbi:MAG: dienelactone hydrolase family protein, partial [Gammaproteobacteria bacterium]|nr:dienelactone hydrolase family protein [Gammaproteobacteria bacterium]
LGADGHDFEPIVDELGLEFGARFVFPHAPVRPVTINGGLPMRAWFDILELERSASWDEQGIRASAEAVAGLIQREIDRGMPSRRVVLAGFSQGGAIALYAGLRSPLRLAGLMALSSFLPLGETLPAEKSDANANTPILLAHGDADPVIPLQMADLSRRLLEAEGYAVDWRVYPMPHAVCAAEIRDIAAWLAGIARADD